MTNKKGDGQNSSSGDKPTEAKNRGWPKGKRRYPKGAGAPKQPLSGYVHFLNERRESVRGENPDITFSELSKKLAAEWSNLPEEEKLKYNEFAKKDKDRYDKEFAEYQNTDQYKSYLESQKEKELGQSNSAPAATSHGETKPKKKKKLATSPAASSPALPVRETQEIHREARKVREERNSLEDSDGELSVAEPQHRENSNSFDIPIFTEEFLDHNKARELELKQLRKQTGEFEEQNAVLGKHIESMKSAITKLEVDTVQQRQSNAALQHQLDQLRQLVVSNFKGVSVPGVGESLTLATADQFISSLHSVLETPGPGHSGLVSSVREVISGMDFSQIIA